MFLLFLCTLLSWEIMWMHIYYFRLPKILWQREKRIRFNFGSHYLDVFIRHCFGLAWINARCPLKLLSQSPFSTGQGRGNMMKGSRVEVRTGRDHSLITVMDKTDWSWGEKERLIYKTPSPHPSHFPGSTSIPFLYLSPSERHRGTGIGRYGQFITCCLCRSSFSGGGLLTLWPCSSMKSLSWESVLHKFLQSESFPWAAALHELPQHGSFPLVQSFRNRLLQCVSPWGHKPCQQTCSCVDSSLHGSTGPGKSLVQHGLPTGSQLPSGIHLLPRGVRSPAVHMSWQEEICSTMNLDGLQGYNLLHHGLQHELQGKNLCSCISSTSSPSFFTDLDVCHTSSHSSLSTAVSPQFFSSPS